MTYKLNPAIGKIESPVVLIFPGGERREYQSGAEVVEAVFDRRFLIESLRAVEDTVEIERDSHRWRENLQPGR